MQKFIRAIRHYSRIMVRELGMLKAAHADLGLSNSEVHALLLIEERPGIAASELSEELILEKSSVSRLLQSIEARGLIRLEKDLFDGRRRALHLSKRGGSVLARIHSQADERVMGALDTLSREERETVMEGLRLYARALAETRRQRS